MFSENRVYRAPVQRIRPSIILCIAAIYGGLAAGVSAQEPATGMEVLISIADQKMAVLRDGGLIQKYSISTSRFGAGDAYRSYKTPLGRLRVCDKVGGELMSGAVIKHREATGEVLDVNAPGRDPIVTRILWLDGLEEQNRNAKARGIYIHGTPEEKKIGEPMSWGCIRMRSRDVMELFDEIPVGTTVFISAEKLPRLHKYEPPKPVIIVVHTPPPTPAPKPAPVAAPPSASQISAVRVAAKPAALAQTTPSPVSQSRIVSTKWSANPVAAISSPLAPAAAVSASVIAMSSVTKTAAKPLPEIAEGSRRKKQSPEAPSLGDAGAMDAFKGSVLFAGLPDARAPLATSSAATPAPAAKNLPPVIETNVETLPQGFSLTLPSAPEERPAGGAATLAEGEPHIAARNPPPTPGLFKTAEHP